MAYLHFVTSFITLRSHLQKPSYNVIDFVMCIWVVLLGMYAFSLEDK